MIHYTIIIEGRVWSDSEAIVRRIARDNPDAAAKWFRNLVKKIDSLESMPERHPIAPESDASLKKSAKPFLASVKINIESSSQFAATLFTFCTCDTARENHFVRTMRRNNAHDLDAYGML
jgi:hypothetical protein